MRLAVIIPTWKRLQKLEAALLSLENQVAGPDLVVITYRPEDESTLAWLKVWSLSTKLQHHFIELDQPGVIYAENKAIQWLSANDQVELVTFMDDDALALPEWISRIKQFFNDKPLAGALGGPDMIVSEPWTYHDVLAKDVGLLTLFGKLIGNHHHRSMGLRQVDALKGVNMTVKKSFLKELEPRLQGTDPAKGNGVFWELDLCLSVKTAGGEIWFDPSLLIHHDSNHSHYMPENVISCRSHNLSLTLMKHLSFPRKIIFIFYALILGDSNVRGIVKTIFDIVRNKNLKPLRYFIVSMHGFFSGVIAGFK
ncbi:MAG TPA: glycosyltransferase [Bacteriovoracaceae bacterium]|nr:glycosyltransferase [Bacteriovoracaceae bacterium]